MFAPVRGTRLYYETHGSGPPMLVMHGGLGWDHGYFRPWLDALGRDVELIYYDHRGNGRSEREVDWDAVDHATWVEDAEALRRHLGHEKILLLGHSYGGFLAQEYALRHPERLVGLILCSTSPALDYPDEIGANAQARGTPESLAGVAEMFAGPVADNAAFRSLTERILPLYFHRYDPAYLGAMFAEHAYSAAAFNRAFGHCVPRFDTTARLGEIRVPTLLLSGGDDWIMPLEHSLGRLQAGIPGAEAHVLERSGHFPFVEETERFTALVRDWLGTGAWSQKRPAVPC
jgi:proline iminopeptidase